MINNDIRHAGVVAKVSVTEIEVLVEAVSACASCHAKGVCTTTDNQDKQITIPTLEANEFKVGDRVEVSIEKTMGIRAVFLAYVIPFVIMMTTLLVLLHTGFSETTSGISALSTIVVWYILLRLFRGKISKDIIFKVEKYNE